MCPITQTESQIYLTVMDVFGKQPMAEGAKIHALQMGWGQNDSGSVMKNWLEKKFS